MPAHRSSDEADIRTDVVAQFRECWPSARIIHEINAAGQGSNRIDVLAVTELSIAAVEIKSKKDKLDRLPDQYRAMRGAAHIAIAAIHEKFLTEEETNRHRAWRTDSDGRHWRGAVPELLERDFSYGRGLWVWPKRRRAPEGQSDDFKEWRLAPPHTSAALPHGALDLLWAAELRQLCNDLRIGAGPKSNMSEMGRQLRWFASGQELTAGICRALRRRTCCEADPAIEEVWQA